MPKLGEPDDAEDERPGLRAELQERVKELSFLHHATRLLNMRGEPRDIIRSVVELLPSAWRYPELAAARVCVGELEIASREYVPSSVFLRAELASSGARSGFVEVSYPEEMAGELPQPFLREEVSLLASCAELLQGYLERMDADGARQELLRAEASERQALSENRAKDQFLSMVAHELRSSLHVMLGWIQVLKQAPPDAPSATRGLTILERNITLQAKLIEDLLDLSRVISGKLRLDQRPLDLTELVAFAVDATRPAAEAKQLHLSMQLDKVGEILGDQQRLQQVVYNVLGNAVKFTPAGGTIEVLLSRLGATARLRVTDSGTGIESELLPHIFEPFRQAGSSHRGRSGGLGLGLSIARHIVELHEGSIHARNEQPPRAGATIEIVLPLRQGEDR